MAIEKKGADTLIGSLSSWNRQEQQFAQLFGEQALKDREFTRMKLQEYNRLYYQFGKKAATTDERAMILMLRFQRKKMTKALYPGLLRRLAYRLIVKAVATVKATRRQPLVAAPVQDAYSNFSIQPPAPKEPATIRRLPYVRSAQFKKMKRTSSKGQSL